MSIKSKAHLIYALNRRGELVSVDTVPNGNDCGCICPSCKDKLCAKNGGDNEKRIHHFAHQAVLIVLAQLNLYYIEWLRTFYMNQNVCSCL